jgi:hypothetical protein
LAAVAYVSGVVEDTAGLTEFKDRAQALLASAFGRLHDQIDGSCKAEPTLEAKRPLFRELVFGQSMIQALVDLAPGVSAYRSALADLCGRAFAVTSIELAPSRIELKQGASITVTATMRNNRGDILTGPVDEYRLNWSVFDEQIALAAGGGATADVIGIRAGETTLRVTEDGLFSIDTFVETAITVLPAGDAFITLSPLAGENRVGSPHVLTGHVEVTGSTGFVNAPDGTVIGFGIASGPGSLSATSCTTIGGTGSCSVTLTSNVVGVTTVSASTTVTVAGAQLSRTTDGVAPNSGNATKTWSQNVDASITLSPLAGVNRVGSPHILAGHVEVNQGTGFVSAPDGTSISFAIVSGPGSLSPASCATTGGTGSCSVTLTSNVIGVTMVSASTAITVGGIQLVRTTDGVAPNSGNATKTWSRSYRITWNVSASTSGTAGQTNPGVWTSTNQMSFEASWSASVDVDYDTGVARNGQMASTWTRVDTIQTTYNCGATSLFNATTQYTLTSPDQFFERFPDLFFPQLIQGGSLVFANELFNGGLNPPGRYDRTGSSVGETCSGPINSVIDEHVPDVPGGMPTFPFPVDFHGRIPADDPFGNSFSVQAVKTVMIGVGGSQIPLTYNWDLRIQISKNPPP